MGKRWQSATTALYAANVGVLKIIHYWSRIFWHDIYAANILMLMLRSQLL